MSTIEKVVSIVGANTWDCQWLTAGSYVAVLFALFLVVVQASPGTRFARSQFGIVAFELNPPIAAKLIELGTGLVRGSCNWEQLEPERGTFNWECSDNVISGTERFGLRSYMTVACTPVWANGGKGCSQMPADVTDWYDFVTNFVARYKSFNTVLGVWNEPNLFLSDNPQGTNYALLYVNASNARNATAPSFVLAGPETSHHALASGYYANAMDTIQSWRAFDSQDVVSVHWYSDGPPLLPYLDAVKTIAAGQDVWLSETGYVSSDLADQARFFDTLLTTFVRSGRRWWTHVIFYRLWDVRDCCTEAILRADYTNKPAFDTYRRRIAVDSSPDAGRSRPR